MNVLIASHLYPTSISRISGSFVHNQVRFLRAHCQVKVVAPLPWFPLPGFGRWSAYERAAQEQVLDGVEVSRPRYLTLPRRRLFSVVWRSYLQALRRAAGEAPDLIHAHCAYPDGCAAVEYGSSINRPVVITVHGYDVKELPRINPRWRALVTQTLNRADAVIAVSQELGRQVRELGVDRGKVQVIPNGVDCQTFKNPFVRRPGEGGWRLLYVGRFDPAKGIGVLLEALGRLWRWRRDFRLTLVGGNAATGTAGAFRARAEELGLGTCVEFLGEVPWAELPGYMQEADIFVLPSFSEGLPLVLVEAMACGLPLLSTRCGGPVEIVAEEVGRLVEPGDAAALEEALAEMMAQYHRYDRRAIRRRAEALYDYRLIAGRIHGIYTEISRSGS